MKQTITTLALLASASVSTAALYSMDFSTPDQGSTHDTGGDAIEASPIAGTNWTLTHSTPSSDSTTNEFITVAGSLMRVQDWGGDGTVTSSIINIVANGIVEITGTGLSIGGDSFNTVGTEGITWFYSINGGTTSTYLGETELGGPVAAGTDVGNSFSSVAVTSGDTLLVGFTVNVNGAGDGVEISALDVEFTPVPEPSSSALLGLGGLALILRRRK